MELKTDKYRKSRGGRARMLKISCEHCRGIVCIYQKDGPGPLKRMYSDRILTPKLLWSNNKKLVCKKCKRWLGIGSIYKKESRRCFILFQDVVTKKILKS